MPRKSFRSITLATVATLVLGSVVPFAWPSIAGAEMQKASTGGLPDHAALEPRIVGISAESLLPTVKQIAPNDAFGWLNYSAKAASISFHRNVVGKMTCTGPSPFELQGDRFRAPSIQSGGFANLCHLAPGEYDYEVQLIGKERPLLGKLVVQAR